MPDPDTPVTQVNFPRGNFTFIFLRLFSLAPTTSTKLPFPSLVVSGTGILISPLKYLPVMEFGFFIISSTGPWATISPPWIPAAGPISTM